MTYQLPVISYVKPRAEISGPSPGRPESAADSDFNSRARALNSPVKMSFIKLTKFQLRVLKEALKIPFGQVRSYSWLARQAGSPRAVRAVGTALNKNPYPLLIPCHRVINNNGDFGRYSQGKNVKKELIQLENELKNMFCLNSAKEVKLTLKISAVRQKKAKTIMMKTNARKR